MNSSQMEQLSFDFDETEHLAGWIAEGKHDKGFKKFDGGKPTFDFLCGLTEELSKVNGVMEYGAEKYERDNWKKGTSEADIRRYKNATLRHVFAALNNEQCDEESGLEHLAHAATNCLFVMYLEKGNKNG